MKPSAMTASSAERETGNLDVVFFGPTDTEMWFWPDRGRSVWDQTFGSLKAASLGSQGTRFDSLLWRMQNGELDGYQAKIVVLQGHHRDQAIGDELVAGYMPIIGEIRARQPQERILLSAVFPRGQLRLEAWRQVAEANARVYARLADDKTVYYVNIGGPLLPPRRLPQQGDVDSVGFPKYGNTAARLQGMGRKSFSPGSTASYAQEEIARVGSHDSQQENAKAKKASDPEEGHEGDEADSEILRG